MECVLPSHLDGRGKAGATHPFRGPASHSEGHGCQERAGSEYGRREPPGATGSLWQKLVPLPQAICSGAGLVTSAGVEVACVTRTVIVDSRPID